MNKALAILAFGAVALTACSGGKAPEAKPLSDFKNIALDDSAAYMIGQQQAYMFWEQQKTDSLLKGHSDEYLKGFREGMERAEKKDAYTLGLQQGLMAAQQLKGMNDANNMTMTTAMMLNGLAYGLTSETAVDRNKLGEQMQQIGQRLEARTMEAQRAERAAAPVSADEQKFLTENKTKEGVKETASGLQYKVVKEGTGAQPTAADEVTVHYTGKLLDGTVFDSSVDRGEPATFPLSRVIPGWTEGLQLMKEGGKTIFYIPSKLAYGPEGAGGGMIPPNATLEFEVELIKVIKK